MCDRGNGGYLPLEQLQRAQGFADKAAEHLEEASKYPGSGSSSAQIRIAGEYIKLAAIERTDTGPGRLPDSRTGVLNRLQGPR